MDEYKFKLDYIDGVAGEQTHSTEFAAVQALLAIAERLERIVQIMENEAKCFVGPMYAPNLCVYCSKPLALNTICECRSSSAGVIQHDT